MITELAGESTASKTQMCLQLLLTVQWPKSHGGLEGSSLYIYTEGEPPMRRLQDLAAQHPQLAGTAFDNIFVERDIANWEDLDQCLERAERLLQQPPGLPLRLIVIDSIAHIYRDAADFGSGQGRDGYAERTAQLFRMAGLLKKYADMYEIAVVVTNQVMDAVGAMGGPEPASLHSGGLKLMSSGREVIPALGPSWACCVNLRIFLSRLTAADMQYVPQQQQQQGASGEAQQTRCMQVVFSSYLPQKYCYYTVSQQGIQGLGALHS
ncbi:g6536 [Coccomyxa elongata]